MTRWVRFHWPDRFKGDPRVLAEQAGLRARRRDDTWLLTTEDEYLGQHPKLLTISNVVGPDAPPDSRTRAAIDRWEGHPDRAAWMDDSRVTRHINKLLQKDDESQPTIDEYIEAHRLLLLVMPDEQVFDWLAGLTTALGTALPDYRVVLMNHSHEIHTRMAYVRALFSKEHAPEWLVEGEAFEGFSSMRGLFGDTFQGNTTFLHPLLAVAAPWMIGTALIRPPSGGAIILFGKPQMGRRPTTHSDLAEGLTTNYLAKPSHVRTPATPDIDVEDSLEALRWCTHGANRLMSIALDPTRFADKNSWYQPAHQMGYLISIDRLLASAIALVVQTGTDEYSRRIHLFQTLDLLEGLGVGPYQKTLNPVRIADHIHELKRAMPDSVQRILLPRCENAQTALEALWEGFHPARKVESMLELLNKKGNEELISRENAISRYLRNVRNAGHSLTVTLRDPGKLSLLAAHDGEIETGISDIAFLHLVRLLADPGILERPLLHR